MTSVTGRSPRVYPDQAWQIDGLQGRGATPQLIAAVERLSGRRVRTFMSGTDEAGGSAVEAFVLELELTAEARIAGD